MSSSSPLILDTTGSTEELNIEQATKLFVAPVPKATILSVYQRFKSKFVQDYKNRGGISPSASEVRAEWGKVKDLYMLEQKIQADKENPNMQLMVWKNDASKEHTEERISSRKLLLEWCESFNGAAERHLTHLMTTLDQDDQHRSQLEAAAKQLEKAVKVWPVLDVKAPAIQFSQLQEQVNRKLKSFDVKEQSKKLFLSLKMMQDDSLMAFAEEHIMLQEMKAEQDSKVALDDKLSTTIMPEIRRYLKKHLRYDSHRCGTDTVEYRRGGTSTRLFQQVFADFLPKSLPATSKKSVEVTLPTNTVDAKPLRYGACMEYTSIVAKLKGSDLTVIGIFEMTK